MEHFDSALTLDSEEDKNRTKSPVPHNKNAPANANAGAANQVVDIYRTLGTTIGIDVGVDKPLLQKKKLQPVTFFKCNLMNTL